jgi:ABC-type antimicrobial peptide transport system permease subunit
MASAVVRLAPGDDAVERLRNAAAGLTPLAQVAEISGTRYDRGFVAVRRGIVVGAVALLGLIGASMLVSALEQLADRRRLLASLVAVGTPPRVLRRSVLLQTTVPVALGLLVALVVGVGLGALLLRIVGEPPRIAVGPTLLILAAGAAVVPLVTLLSAPTLRRVLGPEGLRTE